MYIRTSFRAYVEYEKSSLHNCLKNKESRQKYGQFLLCEQVLAKVLKEVTETDRCGRVPRP